MKQIYSQLKLMCIVAVIGLGTTAVFADWSEPAATPAGSNRSIPVNNGPIGQIKSGGLSVGSSFIARGDARYHDKVFIVDTVLGGEPDGGQESSVYFGDKTRSVDIKATGGLSAHGTLEYGSLHHVGGAVCADVRGKLVDCN